MQGRLTRAIGLALAFAGLSLAAPATAQVTEIDPNDAIDADLNAPADSAPVQGTEIPRPDWYDPQRNDTPVQTVDGVAEPMTDPASDPAPTAATGEAAATATPPAEPAQTYQKDDLIGAAEGLFGKGAEGLASLIEDILKDQGEPNGYIVGREAAGAFVVGLRYGSGTLYHKVEGERPVYWTGPSIGFDAGANAGNTFVLVYNLYDTQDLYKRFGAGEGAAYLVGGFHASYLRRGDVVLIPVRLGVGLRLGVNAGYMKFTEKRSFLPF